MQLRYICLFQPAAPKQKETSTVSYLGSYIQQVSFLDTVLTHRLHGSSSLGLPYRILNISHKKEILWSLWVSYTVIFATQEYFTEGHKQFLMMTAGPGVVAWASTRTHAKLRVWGLGFIEGLGFRGFGICGSYGSA